MAKEGGGGKTKSKYEIYREQLNTSYAQNLLMRTETLKRLGRIDSLKREFQTRKKLEERMFCISAAGIFIMLAQNEILLHFDQQQNPYSNTLKLVNSVATILLLLTLVKRYQSHMKILQLQNRQSPHASVIHEFFWPIALEFIICAWHIPAGVNGSFTVHQFRRVLNPGESSCPDDLVMQNQACFMAYQYNIDVLGVFMVFRLYSFARHLRNTSGLYSQWVSFIGTINNVNAMSPFFHFKALFAQRPLKLLIPMFLYITFLTAALVRLLEMPVQSELQSYIYAVWMTIVTISSVGYGDYFPVTYLGRFFMMIFGVIGGMFFIALVQSIFFGALEMSVNERRVKYVIDRTKWQHDVRHAAAVLIQTQFRLRYCPSVDSNQLTNKLYKYMRDVHRLIRSEPLQDTSFEEEVETFTSFVLSESSAMDKEERRLVALLETKLNRLKLLQ